jgi:hypothetical protein
VSVVLYSSNENEVGLEKKRPDSSGEKYQVGVERFLNNKIKCIYLGDCSWNFFKLFPSS